MKLRRMVATPCSALALFGALVGSMPSADAHDLGLSEARIRVGAEDIVITFIFGPLDGDLLRELAYETPHTDSEASAAELKKLGDMLGSLVARKRVLAPTKIEIVEPVGFDELSVRMFFKTPDDADEMTYRAEVFQHMPDGHLQLAVASPEVGRRTLAEAMLDAQNYVMQIPLKK